jgi:hypothetical protein
MGWRTEGVAPAAPAILEAIERSRQARRPEEAGRSGRIRREHRPEEAGRTDRIRRERRPEEAGRTDRSSRGTQAGGGGRAGLEQVGRTSRRRRGGWAGVGGRIGRRRRGGQPAGRSMRGGLEDVDASMVAWWDWGRQSGEDKVGWEWER